MGAPCLTKAASDWSNPSRWKDVANCLQYVSAAHRRTFVTDSWNSVRRIDDRAQQREFVAAALDVLPSGRRAALADQYADKLIPPTDYDWLEFAKIGLEVSESRLPGIMAAAAGRKSACLALSPRLSAEARNKLLTLALDDESFDHKAITLCFEHVSNAEQRQIALRLVERMTAQTHRRSWKSNLLWAEFIESFAPLATKALGDQVVAEIESATPKIDGGADRALALGTLAFCAPASGATRLAWAAFLALTDTGDGQSRHRLSDLNRIAHLLPGKLTPEFDQSTKRGQMAEELLKQLRVESGKTISVTAGVVSDLEVHWDDATTRGTGATKYLRELVRSLAELSLRDPGAAKRHWTKGLENSASGGRPWLIRYLALTLPLMPSLVSVDRLELVASDVLEVASWDWQ